MSNRINKWIKCEHLDWIPLMYISANMYLFICRTCNTIILRDFNDIGESE